MSSGKTFLLIDSTYLLPLVGVKVVGLPEDLLGRMIASGFNVKINDISLFEVIGKALREAEKAPCKEVAIKRIEIGVKSILLDNRIEKFPICEVETVNGALKLYESGLHDLPNCFIASTAALHTGLLLTESEDVRPAVQRAEMFLKIVKWRDLIEISRTG